MKKFNGMIWRVFFVLLLAVPAASFAYDSSPSVDNVLPEAIWAAATGGGTWQTEVQIYGRELTDPINIHCWFHYTTSGGSTVRGPFTLTGLTLYNMTKYANILQTLDTLDPDDGFSYYGRVGAVWFRCVDADDRISIQARTVHSGGYGKTMNALNPAAEAHTAIFSPYRGMMIQGIQYTGTYRSTIGLFNCGTSSMVVRVALISNTNVWLGYEDITLANGGFLAFNPFIRFGVGDGYGSCRIWISPQSGETGKMMAFGATVNNATNDPAAHVAIQYH